MALLEEVQGALDRDRVIDITTTGRKSGKPSRIEIWFLRIGGRVYITGTPGKRDWYANLVANPDFTFHLKRSAQADLAALATPVLEESERRRVFVDVLRIFGRPESEMDTWVSSAPLVEVTFAAS